MLNFSKDREAKLRYLSGSFQVLSKGDHVLCAVSGAPIALNNLRYWSHELQEAYASAEMAAKRFAQAREKGQI